HWVFVAMAGFYFLRYRYVIALLICAYVFMATVHLALPKQVIPYSVQVFLLLSGLVLMAYYHIVRRSIKNYRRLVESEQTLLRKTRELDNILNSLNAMVAYKDQNNVFVNVNRAMAEHLGIPKEELTGTSLYDLVPPDVAEKFHAEDLEIIRKGKTINNLLEKIPAPGGQKSLWLRSNKTPFFNEKGVATGVVISSEDVTEQVQSEQKLRESELRFRMIFEYAPDGMALISNSTNRFLKVNLALADMFGYSEEELLELTPADISHPDDRYLTFPLFDEAVKNERSHYSAEKRYHNKQGKVLIVSVSVYIVYENHDPQYLILNFKDVTQKRENEKRLQRYARQLEESNQNLQEFAYAASHDLQEPLRTVVSYVQLLKKYLPAQHQTPEIQEFMAYVIRGAKRMETQISALLDYSKFGRTDLNLSVIPLENALSNVKDALHAQIEETQAAIEAENLPSVFADRHHVEALFQNLIGNALKYRRNGNKPKVRIAATRLESEWLFSVADNGIGIEPEYLERVFAVFRRLHTQEQFPGSGVGLAICRRIVQRHGGKIWAESEYGRGATFYFTLPILEKNGHNLEHRKLEMAIV
ncbi:MAG: PAS domain S-box protein, partial [Bacteroidota bacterium]